MLHASEPCVFTSRVIVKYQLPITSGSGWNIGSDSLTQTRHAIGSTETAFKDFRAAIRQTLDCIASDDPQLFIFINTVVTSGEKQGSHTKTVLSTI